MPFWVWPLLPYRVRPKALAPPVAAATYIQSSKLVGTKVKSSQGEEIGVIKDVVLDRNTGCVAYTVLSTGGGGTRVAGGGKIVAVPWAVLSNVRSNRSYCDCRAGPDL